MSRSGALVPLLLLLASPALAREPEAPPQPISVGVVIDSSDAPQLGPRVRTAIRGVLERDGRLTTRPLDLGVMVEPGPLALADGAIQRADKLFREADLDPARAGVEQALKAYEENLVDLVRRDGTSRALRDAYILLAKIRFFAGEFDAAKDALRHVFAIDPKQTFTPLAFPVQMKRVVVEARLLFDTLGFAKLEIGSEPAGAVIYINGARMPNAAPSSFDVPCGPNVVELRLPGYTNERRVLDVGGVGDDGKLNAQLHHGDDPASRAREATATLGDGAPPRVDLDPVAASLDVEALLVVHIAATSETRFRLSGIVYRRARKGAAAGLGARVERSGATTTIEGEADALARALTETLHEGGARVAAETPRRGGWQRFRHSKAFWWVVGGVAGALVVGAAVGAGVGTYEAHQRDLARETVLLGGR